MRRSVPPPPVATGPHNIVGVSELPFIDEYETAVPATPEVAFDALASLVGRSFAGAAGRAFTALLGCAHRGSTYALPPEAGQELNGFRVAAVERPRRLVLEGRHRFASYRLGFAIEPVSGGGSRLSARTDALFPGLAGGVYRLLVIGSGAHAVIAKRMLGAVARKAERRGAGSTISPTP